MQSPGAIEITRRFAEAFECVRKARGHGAIKEFCDKHGINRNQFMQTLKHPDERVLQPYWIAALCRDYAISEKWILFGNGEKTTKRKTAKSMQNPIIK